MLDEVFEEALLLRHERPKPSKHETLVPCRPVAEGLHSKSFSHGATAERWCLGAAHAIMCDGIAVWSREMSRPANDSSQTTLAHESARAQRTADFFDDRVTDPQMQCGMTHLILAVAVEMAHKRGSATLRLAAKGWAA